MDKNTEYLINKYTWNNYDHHDTPRRRYYQLIGQDFCRLNLINSYPYSDLEPFFLKKELENHANFLKRKYDENRSV